MKRIAMVLALILIPTMVWAGTLTCTAKILTKTSTATVKVRQITGSNAGKWYCDTADNMQASTACADLDFAAVEQLDSVSVGTGVYVYTVTDADITIGDYDCYFFESGSTSADYIDHVTVY